jgi:menaquinone-dependent protoporphyrinogen oxidase
MTILIAVAGRHGSTREIADVIAQEMRDSGHEVDVRKPEDCDEVDQYDAVIAGSAVHMGSWMPEAKRFIDRHHVRLTTVPVWLFSSGPLGHDHPQPESDPLHLDEMMELTHARGHQIFAGRLDKSSLGLGERLMVKMVKAPEGDFRNWDAIRRWARDIAAALPVGVPA